MFPDRCGWLKLETWETVIDSFRYKAFALPISAERATQKPTSYAKTAMCAALTVGGRKPGSTYPWTSTVALFLVLRFRSCEVLYRKD